MAAAYRGHPPLHCTAPQRSAHTPCCASRTWPRLGFLLLGGRAGRQRGAGLLRTRQAPLHLAHLKAARLLQRLQRSAARMMRGAQAPPWEPACLPAVGRPSTTHTRCMRMQRASEQACMRACCLAPKPRGVNQACVGCGAADMGLHFIDINSMAEWCWCWVPDGLTPPLPAPCPYGLLGSPAVGGP